MLDYIKQHFSFPKYLLPVQQQMQVVELLNF